MKTNINALLLTFLLAGAVSLDAGEPPKPRQYSAEFERMKTLQFDFDKTCGIDPKKESHMHALTITFDDPDTITTTSNAIMDGKEMPEHPTTLKRVNSPAL